MTHQYGAFTKTGEQIHSQIAIPPGEILKDEVEARGLKKAEFAKALGLLPQHLSEIFSGKRSINAVLALKIEKAWNIDAGFWLRLQAEYELTLARNTYTEA